MLAINDVIVLSPATLTVNVVRVGGACKGGRGLCDNCNMRFCQMATHKEASRSPTVPLKPGMTYHLRSDSPLHSTALSAT